MLDARWVAEHLDEARAGLGRRSKDAAQGLDGVLELSNKRRNVIVQLESKQAARNQANQDMAKLAKTDRAAFDARREELKAISEAASVLERELAEVEAEIEHALSGVPNIPHASVPDGKSEDDNVVVRTWGEKP